MQNNTRTPQTEEPGFLFDTVCASIRYTLYQHGLRCYLIGKLRTVRENGLTLSAVLLSSVMSSGSAGRTLV